MNALPAAVAAEQPGADDDHHVAERCAGSAGVRHGVAVVQEVVGGEVLEQVADRPLDHQREEHRARNVLLGVLRFFPHGGDRLETDQDQNRDARLDEDEVEAVRGNDRLGGLRGS